MTPMPLTYSPAMRRRARPLLSGALLALAMLTVGLWWAFVVELPRQTSGRQARLAAARVELGRFPLPLDAFNIDTGRYPTDAEGLDALWQEPAGTRGWKGPYLQRGIPNDPWGHPYVYQRTVTNGKPSYRLLSLGPDGKRGTADDIVQTGP
jgi:general secretion pathway protein G